ncbi:hypothetical protein BGZ51_006193 [Haplosporangium sp. Z 767]|nr:hypothetical protein BGZ50_006254 [Haplosporangium sp. Z 11]KAF9180456.1 hypothetical protein BGZ51_006193 [Haplosporangium sp. Z 767]
MDVPFPIEIDEQLGERLQPNEANFTTEMSNIIENLIRTRDQPGHAHRDVHAKATGILRGKFTIDENIPAQFAKGVFIPGKTYDCIVRFSNANGNAEQSDAKPDGRGFAMKLLGVPGPKLLESDSDAKTQDFVMINHPIFFTNDAKSYLSLFEKVTSSNPIQKITAPLALGLKGAFIAAKLGSGTIGNPLQIQYYSAVPFQLGVGPDRLAVKFSLKPVSDQKDPIPSHPAEDFLHQAIKKSLSGQEEVRFRFMVQPRVVAGTERAHCREMDVEDSMTEWCQKTSPFQEIATLSFPPQDIDAPEMIKLGERLSFNVWHSLAEHKPLGSMNRARKVVYERISRIRNNMNSVPREEPSA